MGTGIAQARRFQFVAVVVLVMGVAGSFLAAQQAGNQLNVQNTQTGGNISVEFKDADIRDVFRVLALKGNVSIVADPEITGLVTVQITDVPWEKVLEVICRTYGYSYEREGNIIRVTTVAKQATDPLATEVFTLNYANAIQVAAALETMKSANGNVKHDERANLVIVTDNPATIYQMERVIRRLDEMTPQVMIEARIIETTLSDGDDLGIKWNAAYAANMASRPTTFPWRNSYSVDPDGGRGYLGKTQTTRLGTADDEITAIGFPDAAAEAFNFGILDGSSFSVLLQAISSRGHTKMLSNPRITTLDNQEAKIHVGTEWPIAEYAYSEQSDRFVISGWKYKSYGVLLKVTPTINKDGFVTLKINPEISDQDGTVDFQGALVPILRTQTAEATVMIKDGETVVIGGLLKDKKTKTKTKVPLLGDLPILGKLFSHSSERVTQNDLLIFITPRIVGYTTAENRRTLLAELAARNAEQTAAVPVSEAGDSSAAALEAAGEDTAAIDEDLLEAMLKDASAVTATGAAVSVKAQTEPAVAAPEVQVMPSSGTGGRR